MISEVGNIVVNFCRYTCFYNIFTNKYLKYLCLIKKISIETEQLLKFVTGTENKQYYIAYDNKHKEINIQTHASL